MPAARTTRHPDAVAARYSSNEVLPIPASPRSTSTWLRRARTLSSTRSSVPHSLARPRNASPPREIDIVTPGCPDGESVFEAGHVRRSDSRTSLPWRDDRYVADACTRDLGLPHLDPFFSPGA